MSEKVKEEGSFKVKKKPGRPRKLVSQDETFKVDLNKKEEEDAVEEQKTDEVSVRDGSEVSEEVPEENKQETVEEPSREGKEKEEEVITISEVTEEEEKTEEPVAEETTEPVVEQRQLPENIEKLVQFMEETGGTVEDYVRTVSYTNLTLPTILLV